MLFLRQKNRTYQLVRSIPCKWCLNYVEGRHRSTHYKNVWFKKGELVLQLIKTQKKRTWALPCEVLRFLQDTNLLSGLQSFSVQLNHWWLKLFYVHIFRHKSTTNMLTAICYLSNFKLISNSKCMWHRTPLALSCRLHHANAKEWVTKLSYDVEGKKVVVSKSELEESPTNKACFHLIVFLKKHGGC